MNLLQAKSQVNLNTSYSSIKKKALTKEYGVSLNARYWKK
mgnify:CR=1 FL=1